jgi:hypothetical protein
MQYYCSWLGVGEYRVGPNFAPVPVGDDQDVLAASLANLAVADPA